MNIEWALHELRAFEQMTVLTSSRSGVASTRLSTVALDRDITLAAPAVEQILDRVIPDWHTSIELRGRNRWNRHHDATLRAIALLQRQEELREKLGDNAPTLDAGRLHPWVWEGACSLWRSGHYREAVGAAARQVNAETQNKLARRDVSEEALFKEGFSVAPPATGKARLRLGEDDGSRTYSSMHRGAMALAEGLFAAVRNPASHDVLEELPEHEALEQLAAFSVLARWVDRARLATAPPEATS